jgi:hypothetical protein
MKRFVFVVLLALVMAMAGFAQDYGSCQGVQFGALRSEVARVLMGQGYRLITPENPADIDVYPGPLTFRSRSGFKTEIMFLRMDPSIFLLLI